MATIFDYLEWRGDLTFEQDELGIVDALILSSLSYVEFDGIVPAPGNGSITLKEASRIFHDLHTKEELDKDKSLINFAPELLRRLADTARFADCILSDYVSRIDLTSELQFAALAITTSDGIPFVSFRGTDDTIVGWKEDFNLSYKTVPAENAAVEYLEEFGSKTMNQMRLGGHSKGGHLAIYAATGVSSDISSRIIHIYDNDGPGFNSETSESEQFRDISAKITRVIPQGSIIGRLLNNNIEPIIVASSEFGLMQHNPLSWKVMGKNFERVMTTDKMSDLFNQTMTGWIEHMSFDDRKYFVDDLFAVFEASGCGYLSLLSKTNLAGKKAMIDRLNLMSAESADKVKTLGKIFFANWNEMRIARDEERLGAAKNLFKFGKAGETT